MKIPTLENYFKKKNELENLIAANDDNECSRQARYLLRNLEQNIERQLEVIEHGMTMQLYGIQDLLKEAVDTETA